MNYTLIFNAEAESEFATAYNWYEEQQKGLGERFIQEIERQLEKIKAGPLTYRIAKKGFRELSVIHFPFTIVYAVNEARKTVYISSVFHTSRNPKEKYRK